MEVDELGEEQELDLSNSDVVTKYKAAAEICNNVMEEIVKLCKPGTRVADLTAKGNDLLQQQVGSVFKGKKIEKGIAMPTCISLNNCVGHFCPLSEDATTMAEGDVAKIDLGVHIDGWIAVQAHTLHVQADPAAPVKGRAADVIMAAQTAFEAAIRAIKPGNSVVQVAPVLEKVAEAYGCTLVEGVMSHQMKQHVIDGNKCILNRSSPDNRVEDAEFEENEVYAVDIVMSTGEGQSKVLDEKETVVFKRALDAEYQLKLKASRAIFSEIIRKYPTMPFSIRDLDTKQTRLGLVECLNHGLLHPFPVLYEKNGELVAQVKGTVLLMPNGNDRVTKAPLQDVKSDKEVTDEEVKALLAQPLKAKKKKPKKKGEGTSAEAAGASTAG